MGVEIEHEAFGVTDHANLTGVTADQHHAKSHAHNGADGSGTVAHVDTTGKTADDHHNQAHVTLSADHSDSLAGSVVDGDVIIGNATPKWSRLGITVPAANVRNVLGVDNGETRPSWKSILDGTAPTTSAPGDAAAAGTSLIAAHRDHVHGRESYATQASNLKQYVRFINAPDAAPGALIQAGNQQGNIFHSGPNGFTATKLYVDCETAPGASGLPVTWEYGDTNDLDTVASWTTIATLTLSSEKSSSTTSMTNATVPADRLVRTNYGTIVGSPADCTTTLEGKEVLTT